MCGIFGFNWKDNNLIDLGINMFSHRGPDDHGSYSGDLLSLGHTRLSIIDLSPLGKQPMEYFYEGNKYLIVYNGEIFNFKELKIKYQNLGYKFNTESDTEVILVSYIHNGINFENELNGMWAFCLYDVKKEMIYLSRDRLGEKPLFWFFNDGKFVFSSELKFFTNLGKREISRDAIDLYLSLGFVPSPFSVIKNVNKLEPRNNLRFNLRTKILETSEYFEIPNYNPISNKNQLIQETLTLLKDAVRLRLISDVPVGAFLSGGLDSSTCVALMASFINLKNLNTFSIGFEGKFDESDYINLVKNEFNTIHHHSYFNQTDFDLEIKEFCKYYDEPFGDPSLFPSLRVSKNAKKDVKVVITGDGGDEVFGGYFIHQIVYRLVLLRKIPKVFRKLFLKILIIGNKNPKSLLNQIKEGLRLSLLPNEDFYLELMKTDHYKSNIYKKWIKERFSECLLKSNNNLVEAIIKMDYHYLTLGDNFLQKVDRATMANSIEARSPFLDYRFILQASKIPTKMKVNFFNGKLLMREMIKNLVPDAILKRGKKGFVPPIEEWITEEKYLSSIREFNYLIQDSNYFSEEFKEFTNKLLLKKDFNGVEKIYLIRILNLKNWFDMYII